MNTRRRRAPAGLAILAATVVVAACTSVKAFENPEAGQFQPVRADSVRVFERAEEVPSCHITLARLDGSGTVFNTEQGMVEAFQRKAGEVGANGVLLRGYDTATWGTEAKAGRALAIRYGLELCEDDEASGSLSSRIPVVFRDQPEGAVR